MVASSALASTNGLVVSEFRVRGPVGGNDEFVELRNTSGSDVDISGYTLRGCANGSPGNVSTRATVPEGTTLEAGQHYLFTNSQTNGSGYSGAVEGDQTYATGFSDFTSTSYAGIRVENAAGTVIDGVGAPNSPCREGSGVLTSTTTGDQSFERKPTGVNTQDTDDNAADFEGPKAGNPQNSGGITPPDPACSDGEDNDGDGQTDFPNDPGCESAGDDDEANATGPTITKIHDIQGSGATSSKTGQTVTIEGVVTGVDDEIGASFGSGNTIRRFPEDAGIFVQEEASDVDTDPNTSEGIFVGYVTNRANYAIGDVVRLNGVVNEKFDQTIISETINQEPVEVGTAPAPEPIVINESQANTQNPDTRPYYESLEGMRVSLATGTANSGGTTKFGELFMTPGPEQDRVFRTDVEPALIATDADAGAGDPDNPYRDPDGSTTEVEADLFDTVTSTVGPLSYSFDHYKIMVQPNLEPTVADTGVAYPFTGVAPAGEDQFRLASFNVENFFPAGGALDGGTVTQEEYDEKRQRIADAIGDLLESPDVVAVQEAVNLQVLEALAAELETAGYGNYTAYLEEGNDSRGIDVGFLVKDTVTAENVRQLGKDATEDIPETSCSDVAGGLFDRPPLAADITTQGGKEFTVFSNHFSSKAAPDACRVAQAAFVRDRVAEVEEAGGQAIVAGDLNAFEDESALTTLEGEGTTLDNQWDRAPAENRYSFAFSGRLQTLDHVLITSGIDPLVEDFEYAHFDNDYHERDAETSDGHKVSDHDPPVLTLDDSVPPPPSACNDGEDDDGDGQTDFPDDPGCSSADDDDETDEVPPDTTAPETTIDSGPSGTTDSDSASFDFSSSESGSKFECSLDGAAFTACDPPETYDDLTEGSHTFRVRATDAAGNTDDTPAERTWTVDTAAPTVERPRPASGSSTKDRTPTIGATVTDNDPDFDREDIQLYVDGDRVTSFEYDGDSGRLAYTPQRKLSYGGHKVRVVAEDAAGNATTEQWGFRVRR